MSSRERQQAVLQEWAAKQLSVLPGEAPATIRSQFLRLVDKQSYFPGEEVTLAFEALTGQIEPDPSQPSQGLVWSLVEAEVGQDVDRFAHDFFTLDCDERRQRWQTLQTRCGWSPVLTARLKELKPGLEIGSTAFTEDRDERTLIDRLQELFVLMPAARAARRREIIAGYAYDFSRWQRVAKQVRRKFPVLTTLDPELFRYYGRERLGLHFGGPIPNPEDATLGSWTWLGSLIVIGFVLFVVSLFDNPSKQQFPKFKLLPGIHDEAWHKERKRIIQELFKDQLKHLDQELDGKKDAAKATNNQDRDKEP